jgi:hypothetical protein
MDKNPYNGDYMFRKEVAHDYANIYSDASCNNDVQRLKQGEIIYVIRSPREDIYYVYYSNGKKLGYMHKSDMNWDSQH